MTNIIKVDFKGEDEKNGYTTYDDGSIGVVNKTTKMKMCSSGEGFFIYVDKGGLINRKEMAEFLWMSAYMLDSEGRYKFDKYVGLNYKDGE